MASASIEPAAYSMVEPVGRPLARRVTVTLSGVKSELIYRAVPSPSILGLVAMTISLTEPVRILFTSWSMVRSDGSMPSRGAMWPFNT